MHRVLQGAAVALVLLVAACAPFVLVPAGERQDVRGAFTIDVYRPWNRANPQAPGADQAAIENWTIDGPGLDQLLMIVGTRPGAPLFEPVHTGDTPRQPLPPYRAEMAPTEIAELYEASLSILLHTALFETRRLQPADLGNSAGFRFEYAYTTRDSIDRYGVAYATVRGGMLYLIAFHGPRIHHFPTFSAEVERMIASVRFNAEVPRR